MPEYPQSNDLSSGAGVRLMTGFMIGAVLGAGIALLLAPATGEETRRRLGETARRLRDNTGEALDNVRERFRGVSEEARETMASESGARPRTATARPA
jgi:gas vesicle protein